MRLPRPCRLRVERVSSFARQLGIAEALASDLTHRQIEAVSIIQRIVLGCAIVVAEDLLRNVAVKMERFNRNIGAAKTALQQTPEVLDSLSVDFTANVLFDVIHSCVNEVLCCKAVIDRSAVRINFGAALDLIQDFIQQSLTFGITLART